MLSRGSIGDVVSRSFAIEGESVNSGALLNILPMKAFRVLIKNKVKKKNVRTNK